MITTADALEVMAIVMACHPRTAPRMDDREVALATASVWAELFAEYDFTKPELIAAVKDRAKACPEAPEAADIIRCARNARSDRMARAELPSPQASSRDEHYPGDAKAAPDPAEYPAHWTSEQRLGAYWFALRMNAIPRTTAGWEAIARQLEDNRDQHADVLTDLRAEPIPGSAADKIAAARQALDAEQAKL